MKKGFTLIELLAVIVILAIIALIATPAVLKTINDSKRSAAEASARNIIRAAESHYMESIINNDIVSSIDLSTDTLKYDGEQAKKGIINYNLDGNAYGRMYISGFCIDVSEEGELTSEEIEELNCKIVEPTDSSCFVLETIEINGKKVENGLVKDYKCFEGNTYGLPTITDVVIPDSVVVIGNAAFFNNNLTSVRIPNNVTTIEKSAFLKNKLTSITIPKNVKSIGEYAFQSNQLRTLTIPDTVTDIKKYAFSKNELTKVNIPNSITTISAGIFWDNQLTSITIPKNVKSIGEYAFLSNQLQTLTIPDTVTDIKKYAFSENQITSVKLSNNLTSLDRGIFKRNQITSITIPSKVTSIGEAAFSENQLTDLVIPGTVKTIEILAFQSNKIENLTLSSGIKKIGDAAFNVNRLTSITIPDSVIEMGYAFTGNRLTDNEAFIYKRTDTNNDGIAEIDTSVLICYGGARTSNVVIPDNVKTIEKQALFNSFITSITIPDSVTTIKGGAFNNCSFPDNEAFIYKRTDTNNDGIAEIDTSVLISYGGASKSNVVIPDNVKEISDYAFDSSFISSVTIPNSVTKIGQEAFRNNHLTSIEIPNSVTSIGNGTFYNNENLTSIIIDKETDSIPSSPWGAGINTTIIWKRG